MSEPRRYRITIEGTLKVAPECPAPTAATPARLSYSSDPACFPEWWMNDGTITEVTEITPPDPAPEQRVSDAALRAFVDEALIASKAGTLTLHGLTHDLIDNRAELSRAYAALRAVRARFVADDVFARLLREHGITLPAAPSSLLSAGVPCEVDDKGVCMVPRHAALHGITLPESGS